MKPAPSNRNEVGRIWSDYASFLSQDDWDTWLSSLAVAFQAVYDDKVVERALPGVPFSGHKASAQMTGFVRYLTDTDPDFPSWVFVNSMVSESNGQIFHPKYKEKLERYHAAWKQFLRGRASGELDNIKGSEGLRSTLSGKEQQ